MAIPERRPRPEVAPNEDASPKESVCPKGRVGQAGLVPGEASPVSRPRLFRPAPGDDPDRPRASEARPLWRQHLIDAEGGVKQAVRGDSIFFVLMFTSAAVVTLGFTLGLSPAEWAMLAVAGASVASVELLRQVVLEAVEIAAERHRSRARRMFRLATAASSVASAGAAIGTLLIFGARLGRLFGLTG